MSHQLFLQLRGLLLGGKTSLWWRNVCEIQEFLPILLWIHFLQLETSKIKSTKKIDIWHDPIFMKVFPSLLSVKMHRNMSVPEMLMTVIFES